MFDAAVAVNVLPVLLAGAAQMAIGFIWYNPAVFGKEWMRLTGISMKDIESKKAEMPKTYAVTFAATLVTAYVLAIILKSLGAATIQQAAQVGFLAWLGFVATTMLAGALYAGKPLKLYALETGYHLVSLVVMAAILVGWA